MTSDVGISIEIKSKGSGAKTIKRDLDNIAASGNKATSSSKNLEKQMGATSRATVALTRAVTGLMTAYGLRALMIFSDNITTLETQLKNVTRNTEEYTRRFNDLYNIAQSTGDAFGDLTQNFVRLNSSLPDAVKNTTDLTKVTELLSRGFAASGANAQAAGAVMTQLTQGLAGNFANASQEINSLIEGTPLLAKIIAEELGGKAATDLKKFAQEGKLTTESFLGALLASEEAIKAYEIPPTISRSLQRISNEFIRLGSESKLLESSSNNLAAALDVVAKNLGSIANLLKAVTAGTIAWFAVMNVGAVASIVKGIGAITASFIATQSAMVSMLGATGALRLALISLGGVTVLNPLGLAAVAVGSLVASVIYFKDEFGGLAGLAAEVSGNLAAVIVTAMGQAGIAIDKLLNKFADLTNFLTSGPAVLYAMLAGGLSYEEATNALGDYNTQRKNNQSNVGRFSGQTPEDIRADVQNILSNIGSWQQSVQGGSVARETTIIPPVLDLPAVNENVQEIDKSLKSVGDTIKENIANRIDKDMTESIDDLSNAIERDLSTAFKDAFTNSEGVFDRFISGLKSSFMNFLGEIAYQAAARPILLSLGIAGGTALGGSSASAGGLGSIIGGGSSGGFSIGNLGSLLSNGFSGLTSGLSAPIFGASSLIGSGINSIGASLGLTNANFIGPMLPGTSSLASAFTPAAGLAGFGGNMLANALFGSDRGIGASIGGIAGGIGGTAIGASMGTILGFAGGPAGALIGAFAGNALGGLFGGGSVPSRAIDGGFDVSNGMIAQIRATSNEASPEQQEQFNAISSQITQSTNAFLSGLGAKLTDDFAGFMIATARRDGIFADIEGRDRQTFGSIEDAINYALTTSFSTAKFTGISDVLAEAVRKSFSENTTFESGAIAALEAKQIIDLIEGFEKIEESINPLQQALEALDEQFAELKTKAQELGLPVDKLTDSYEKQRQAFITGALQPLQDFLDSQALSGSSTLSAVERLSLARANFDENLSAIQGGDLSGLGNITSQASQLLGLGRDVFASGEGFSALESFVRQSITGIGEQLGGEGALSDSIAREITLSNAQQTSVMQQMLVELEELRKENKDLRKAMERIGNSLNA